MSSLTQEQTDEYKEAFWIHAYEMNLDGHIPPGVLGQLLKSLGFDRTEAELQTMINSLDMKETNGQINLPMFLDLMASLMNGTPAESEEEIIEAFRVFDKEKNGMLSAEQIRHMMKGCEDNSEEINEMIKEAGFEIDGLVDYKEFIKIMMAK